MQRGHEIPFELTENSFTEIEQEIQHTKNLSLIHMGEKLKNSEVDALEYVGTAYLCGNDGLKADFEKAISILRLAAEGGSTTAQLYIADCYAFGIGVDIDVDIAKIIYRMASQSPTAYIRSAALEQLEKLNQQ